MDLGLLGKRALVAGGARGGGLAIAKELAKEGALVTITGRDPALVRGAVDEIRALGFEAHGTAADIALSEGCKEAVAYATAACGTPQILIVNPPSPPRVRGLEETSDAVFEAAHNQWAMTLVRLARHVVANMKVENWGRIVALGSIGMKSPHLKDPVYVMNTRVVTAAVIKTMAQEFGPFNICANCVAVGPFRLSLSEGYLEEKGARKEQDMVSQTAMNRWGEPRELAALVTFLCSTRASFITGETIRIDGNAGASLF